MDKLNPDRHDNDITRPGAALEPTTKSEWETPTLEDVSEQVMAQPYIRFT